MLQRIALEGIEIAPIERQLIGHPPPILQQELLVLPDVYQ